MVELPGGGDLNSRVDIILGGLVFGVDIILIKIISKHTQSMYFPDG